MGRACLKDVPDNVIFHLKRFDFNLRTLQRSKINDYFTFPAKINLAPYTVEHISGLEVAEDIFELVGVLVHAGTAESGHYYSYIRERPTQDGRCDWVEFNDDNVSAWDPTLMEASTFGGANRAQPADPSGVIYDKPYSAYMLFYQRSSSLAKQAQDMPQHASPVPLHVPVDAEQKEHIFEENSQLLRRHCLYDPGHLNLVKESFLHARELTEGGPMGTDPTTAGNGTVDTRIPDQLINDLAMEMLLSHFDQVVCRTKDLPQLGEFSRAISTAITTSCQSALSLYDYFRTRPMALRSLIQRNPDPSVRLYAGNTLLLALRKIASDAPFLYDMPRLEDSSKDASQLLEIERARIAFWRSRGREPDQQDYVLHGALKIFKYLWKGFPVYIRAWDEFFKIILGFAKMGGKEVARLLADNWLLKLSRIIVADQTTELPNNYNRMVQNVQRRFTNRPPPYAAIIATIDYLLQQLTPDLGPDTIVDSALDRQDQCEAPFMWATEEVNLFHMHHGRYDVNLFAEKLIALDQFQGSTDRIIVRLIGTGEHMDMAIASTLRTNIRREDSSHATEPFLRMSIQYLENTASLQRASQLVTHVAKESRHMQITEAPAIVSFFRAALALKRPEEAVASQIHSLCITLIPDWVPCLLVHYDTSVRAAIAEILELELFRFGPEYQADDEGGMLDNDREPMILTVQRLGVACLEYLRDAYVRRRAQIGRDQANIVSRVINHCGQAFENDGRPASDDLSVEFGLLRIGTCFTYSISARSLPRCVDGQRTNPCAHRCH
jgi:ubiquitin carboxyl-terminal hydrolase 34